LPLQDKGEKERLLELTVNEPDFEWLMIDGSHIKVYPHAVGVEGIKMRAREKEA